MNKQYGILSVGVVIVSFRIKKLMWHMAEKQNNYGIHVRVQSIIIRRGTGRGLPSASLSSNEQREPHNHEA
jgi:hypothetical protein